MGFFQSVGKAIGSVASPLVSGAFGIGSSLLSNKAQSDANKQNMRIAQMNNEWSEKMMEKQHQYDVEMWNMNNEYNSAKNQAKRFEEAGLNPALMMGASNAGTASGGSSVGMPSPTTPNIQPLRYDGFANAINNTVQMSMALSRNNAEIDAIDKRVDNETALAKARIAEMYEETRSAKFRNELNEITKDLQISHMNEDYLKKVQERTNMEEQHKLIQQQIVAQELINGNLPEKLAMDVAVMASQRDLNNHNAQHEVGKLIETLKKRGFKLSKSQENAIFEAVISKVENDANQIASGWQLIGNTISAVKRIITKLSKD